MAYVVDGTKVLTSEDNFQELILVRLKYQKPFTSTKGDTIVSNKTPPVVVSLCRKRTSARQQSIELLWLTPQELQVYTNFEQVKFEGLTDLRNKLFHYQVAYSFLENQYEYEKVFAVVTHGTFWVSRTGVQAGFLDSYLQCTKTEYTDSISLLHTDPPQEIYWSTHPSSAHNFISMDAPMLFWILDLLRLRDAELFPTTGGYDYRMFYETPVRVDLNKNSLFNKFSNLQNYLRDSKVVSPLAEDRSVVRGISTSTPEDDSEQLGVEILAEMEFVSSAIVGDSVLHSQETLRTLSNPPQSSLALQRQAEEVLSRIHCPETLLDYSDAIEDVLPEQTSHQFWELDDGEEFSCDDWFSVVQPTRSFSGVSDLLPFGGLSDLYPATQDVST